ncbi:hypothetical protein AVEN_10376-1 [Araneus ventricosus]|uniref:Uncharacterized protein n=1 Tax=Araneus ventricosus TaxID=182803 RepID=A0A4Y2GYU0_ARAVE|nr:hypothetical protein AVEN_10376-1 [Araneus ventricosus]
MSCECGIYRHPLLQQWSLDIKEQFHHQGENSITSVMTDVSIPNSYFFLLTIGNGGNHVSSCVLRMLSHPYEARAVRRTLSATPKLRIHFPSHFFAQKVNNSRLFLLGRIRHILLLL